MTGLGNDHVTGVGHERPQQILLGIDKQTDGQTDGHRNSMTDPESVKTRLLRRLQAQSLVEEVFP